MSSETSAHRDEVTAGQRFEFGANWAAFLSVLDDTRIAAVLGFAAAVRGDDPPSDSPRPFTAGFR